MLLTLISFFPIFCSNGEIEPNEETETGKNCTEVHVFFRDHSPDFGINKNGPFSVRKTRHDTVELHDNWEKLDIVLKKSCAKS